MAFLFYENRELPIYFRNSPFVLVPAGLAILLGVAAAELESRNLDRAASTALAAVLSFAFIAIWWSVRPPGWMKPGWLRSHERRESEDYRAAATNGDPTTLPGPVYVALWAVWAVLVVLWFVLDWPLTVLAGIGFATAILLAVQPSDAEDPTMSPLTREIFGDGRQRSIWSRARSAQLRRREVEGRNARGNHQ